MIKIICVGKLKEKYLKDASLEYLKRIQKYTKLEIIELEDEGISDKAVALRREKEKILKNINSKDFIITLEIEGEQFTSVEFSKKIESLQVNYPNICFIIGGSYGIDDEIKSLSQLKLSFSSMTFPHQLFRIMLLEQIYRAYKIKTGESYHK